MYSVERFLILVVCSMTDYDRCSRILAFLAVIVSASALIISVTLCHHWQTERNEISHEPDRDSPHAVESLLVVPGNMGAKAYLKSKGGRGELALWDDTADSTYWLPPIHYNVTSGRIGVNENAKYKIDAKFNTIVTCIPSATSTQKTILFCLVKESGTLGKCAGLSCCSNALDTTIETVWCPARKRGKRVYKSVFLTASPRLLKGDALYVFTNNTDVLSGTISLVVV